MVFVSRVREKEIGKKELTFTVEEPKKKNDENKEEDIVTVSKRSRLKIRDPKSSTWGKKN